MARQGKSDRSAPQRVDTGVAAQFDRLGAPVDDEGADETMDVLEVNWTAVSVFIGAASQWRIAQIGGGLAGATLVWLGIDYAGLDALMRRRRIRDPQIFEDVRLMEHAALAAFAGIPEQIDG